MRWQKRNKENVTLEDIADDLGVDERTVRRRCKKVGLAHHPTYELPNHNQESVIDVKVTQSYPDGIAKSGYPSNHQNAS